MMTDAPDAVSDKPTLVEQIQNEALDGTTSVADILRKCVALGGRAGSADLRDWANRELRGYENGTVVPDYRKAVAPMVMDGQMGGRQFHRMPLTTHDLPEPAAGKVDENLDIRFGVGELESIVIDARQTGKRSVRLGLPGSSVVARLMSAERGYFVERVYWDVSVSALNGVLQQVRNRLVELSTEIMAVTGNTSDPSSEVVGNAMTFVMTGKRAKMNVNAAAASGAGQANVTQPHPGDQRWSRRAKTVGAFVVGVATIIGVWIAWLALVKH